MKLELENEKIQEKLNAFEASEVEEMKAPSSLSMKINVISGQTFGMVPQGSRIQSIITVAGHQVIKNLSEPSEFTTIHLDTYAEYLRQVDPRTESRAVRALLTTGGPRTMKLHGRHVEVYGPYKMMLNVMRVKEEAIPATRTGGKIQRAMIVKRGIQETLHQWSQPLNL